MRRWGGPALAALPGAVIAATALLGPTPTLRDLPGYFVPLRARTAEVLRGARGPFWNPDVGCGEPFLANPQSVLLYPPAWLAVALPAERAVGVEIGLHLAWLAAGCALLARRLGAGTPWLEAAAGWGAVLAGPLADAAGVLNNLDSVAWLPWLARAALAGSLPGTALTAAAAFLAAEPQLAVVAGAVALTLAPRRRTVAGLALAVGLVAVQALPFVAWVAGGDRGPGPVSIDAVAGSPAPADLARIVFPGALPRGGGDRFVAHPAVPLWLLVLGALAAFDRRPEVRRLAWWGWGLALAAALAGLPGVRDAWTTVTFSLVRYPGRLVFPALVALAPAAVAAAGARRWPRWSGIAVAAVGMAGLGLGASALETVGGAVAAGAVLASPWAGAAALAGAALLGPRQVAALELRPPGERPPIACLEAQLGPGRFFAVQPSRDQLAWVAGEPVSRASALGWGYTPLLDGRRAVRSFAPLSSRAFSAHLAEADRGPAGRWWLDSLAARRIVAHHPVDGFPERCRAGKFVVLDNAHAWPEVAVASGMPTPGDPLVVVGEVVVVDARDDVATWRAQAGAAGGLFLRAATPDPGWTLRVDGRPTPVLRGPGIVHGVTLGAGEHEVQAVYRPPGLGAGAAISLLSTLVVGMVAWRRW